MSTASLQVLLQQGLAQEPQNGSCLVPSCWLRMNEAACLSTGGFTGSMQGCAGWERLTASHILTVPCRGTSMHHTEIVGE